MFTCPHCQKPIEVGPRQPVPWYRYDSGNPNVGLGCGTLLAIAIIVAMCGGVSSRSAMSDLSRDIDRLTEKVGKVEAAIERLAPTPQDGQPAPAEK